MTNQKIISELERLAQANGGRLTADQVVAAAQSKDSVLWAYFESRGCWDAKKAQAHYCVHIARELIRSVKVEIRTETYTLAAPAYVRDPSAGTAQGYASLSRLRSDQDNARQAVIDEFSRASAALARAQSIAAALNLSDEISELRGRVDAFYERIEESAGAAAH